MKIVFLDVKTIGEDIDLCEFDRFGEVVKYDFSTSEEVPERVQDAGSKFISAQPSCSVYRIHPENTPAQC